MKYRYKWIVLTLFLCGFGFSSSAQKIGEPLVNRIDKILDLSDSQETQVADALSEARQGYTREDIKAMSDAERAQMKKEMMTKFVVDVEKILTPAQVTKFATMKSKLLR